MALGEAVLFLPLNILRCFGFFLESENPILRKVASWLRFLLIISLYCSFLLTSSLPTILIFVQFGSTSGGLLTFASLVPSITTFLRGPVVLTILVVKEVSLTLVIKKITNLVQLCFPVESELERKTQRWKRFATISSLLAVLLHFWLDSTNLAVAFVTGTVKGNPYPEILSSFQFSCLIVVGYCVEFIGYILSQQLFVIVLTIALIMADGGRKIKDSVRNISDYSVTMEQCFNFLKFGRQTKRATSTVLFFIYGFDLLTFLAYVASSLGLFSHTSGRPIILYYGCLVLALFAFYATVALVPLILAQESAGQIRASLQTGTAGTVGRMGTSEQKRVAKMLIIGFTCHPIVLDGARLVFFTRTTVFQVVPITISFLVVAYEILIRSMESEPCTCCHNVAHIGISPFGL